jgi:hypothetical protein
MAVTEVVFSNGGDAGDPGLALTVLSQSWSVTVWAGLQIRWMELLVAAYSADCRC